MSREEATRELKILKENYWDDDGYGHETKQYDDTMLALDMAIQALSQECVGSTQKHVGNALDMRCDDAISQAKTGYWIEVTNGRGGHECSLCHEYAPSYQNGDEWLTKYCPNCGARMIEPQERSE